MLREFMDKANDFVNVEDILRVPHRLEVDQIRKGGLKGKGGR